MDWDLLARGQDCPFDQPRSESTEEWDSIAKLDASTLCLFRNQTYRGHSILIYDPKHAASPDQLTPEEWAVFCNDAHRAVVAIRAICHPDHVNLECLGNQMPHLHWHVIPRYKDDARWPNPIWKTNPEELDQTSLIEDARLEMIEQIRVALA